MEGEEEPTKKCGTCERDIPQSKFRMHEIGCARNNYKCRECGEVVQKCDREEHEAEAHVKVKCQYCSFEAVKGKFGDHEENCDFKPKQCSFCDSSIPFDKFHDHQVQCGSRTRQCMNCTKFVMMRDQDMHDHGGECQAYKDELKRKKEEEERSKAEAMRRLAEEEERQKQKMAAQRAQRERQFEQNFDINVGGTSKKQVQQNRVSSRGKAQQDIRGARANSRGYVKQPVASSSSTAQQKSNPVITNKRTSQTRTSQQSKISSYTKPKPAPYTATGGGIQNSMNQNRIPPRNQFEERKQPVITNTRSTASKPQISSNAARKPSSRVPPKSTAQQDHAMATELDQQLIEQILAEDESRAMAERLQNEMYQGADSARGNNNNNNAQQDWGAQMQDQQMDEPRYNAPPVYDQLIGGGSSNNYGSAQQEVPIIRNATQRQQARDMGMNPSDSMNEADMERAIQASLAFQGNQLTEEEQMQRIMEESRFNF